MSTNSWYPIGIVFQLSSFMSVTHHAQGKHHQNSFFVYLGGGG
ncbi:TPA: hypothetical protein ACX6QA_000038 [Photobacterium damselae]